jgi:hypothetical protein
MATCPLILLLARRMIITLPRVMISSRRVMINPPGGIGTKSIRHKPPVDRQFGRRSS